MTLANDIATLATDIDATYADRSAGDKIHQQYHDRIHRFLKAWTAAGADQTELKALLASLQSGTYAVSTGAPPMSWSPVAGVTAKAPVAANETYAFRSIVPSGKFTISKIGLEVQTASGNLCVGVLRASNGVSAPNQRIATSGSVAATGGYMEISLGASVEFDPATDYLAVAFDNTAIRVYGPAGGTGTINNMSMGQAYRQAAPAFPIPAVPSMIANNSVLMNLKGLA